MKKGLTILAASMVLSLAIVPTFAMRYSHRPIAKPTGYDYELVTPNGSVTPDGLVSSEDDPKLQSHGRERLFVKRSGKMYEITDLSTVAAVRAVLLPLAKGVECKSWLGKEKDKLTAQQEELARRHSEITRQQAAIHARIAEEPAATTSAAATQALEDELGDKLQAIESQIQDLNDQLDKVNQKKLDCKDGEHLQVAKVAADAIVRDAISSTIAKGHVKPVGQTSSTATEISAPDGSCIAFEPLP